MATRGQLAGLSYPELIKQLCDQGATARLMVRRGSITKVTYLVDGRLVFARSSDANDRLGEFLLRRGSIGVGQYLDSVRRIGPGRRQGAILCEMGAISADDLVRCVKDQVTEILFTQFDWNEGEWEIVSGVENVSEMIVLNLPIEDVILTGSRRIGDWGRVWRGIGGSLDTVFTLTPGAHGLRYRANLNDEEAHLLGVINGRLPLGRVLELGYGSNFASCRSIWAFRMCGAVVAATGAEDATVIEEDWALAERIEAYDRVFTFIHSFVAERLGDLVDHFFDRAIQLARSRAPRVLAGVHMRNQGRIEYEDVFANVAAETPARRGELGSAAMDEVLAVLLALSGKELGREEEAVLREQLALLAREVPAVPLAQVLKRAPDPLA